jgi:hypothetical protein
LHESYDFCVWPFYEILHVLRTANITSCLERICNPSRAGHCTRPCGAGTPARRFTPVHVSFVLLTCSLAMPATTQAHVAAGAFASGRPARLGALVLDQLVFPPIPQVFCEIHLTFRGVLTKLSTTELRRS